MRVAIITESFLPRTDGVVRTVVEFLRYLRTHDQQALVFAAGPGPETAEGFAVIRVRGPRFPLYPALTIAPFSTRMLGMLRVWRPDVVHLASPFVLGVQGRWTGQALGVPVAAHYQTDVARYAQHFRMGLLAGAARRHLVKLHNACTVTYAPTPSVCADLIAQGIRNVHVLGRGVDGDLFRPERRSPALRRTLLRDGEQTLFLYVGRLSKEKNLESLAPMLAALPGVRLICVGEGPYRATLEQAFRGLRATFVGIKHGEELATIYASADVFVFPSLTETFGQVVQEAMASGLPVLAYRAGGVQDLLRDGWEGYLCPPGDSGRWRETARLLATDSWLRDRLGAHARQSAAARTWDAIFARLLGEYDALIRHTPRSRANDASSPETNASSLEVASPIQ
ncbi:MAG TPA: glycosyltransferase family 1 protein [Chloroflexota bacterium]|nr:glycosyltransferase family 1 protein [Chloroflexota bacterium]